MTAPVTSESAPKLAHLDISYAQPHRWQAAASVPEPEFDEHVAAVKDAG